MINFFQKNKIEYQIEEYIEWKQEKEHFPDLDTLKSFLKFCAKKDIRDIREVDVQNYYRYLDKKINTAFQMSCAMKEIRRMFRYFKARKYDVVNPNLVYEHRILIVPTESDTMDGMKMLKVGRPPHIEDIRKIKTLRDKAKLSFREISRALGKDVKNIYYQYNYSEEELKKLEKYREDILAKIENHKWSNDKDIKELIRNARQLGIPDSEMAPLLQITRSRVQQIRTEQKKIILLYSIGGGRNLVREKVRIRDKYTCQKCDKKWEKGQRRFDVHHTDESLEGRSKERGIIKLDKANTDKMITLCHKCHFNTDSVRAKIKRSLSTVSFA